MNTEDICDWVKAHPEHDLERQFKGCESYLIFMRLCYDLTQISDYEDPLNSCMKEDEIENGCTYLFKGKSTRCNCPPVSGTKRCKFHNHPIFSDEFTNWVNEYHKTAGTAC